MKYNIKFKLSSLWVKIKFAWASCAIFFISCGGDDSGPSVLDACGNPTTAEVTDDRCLYQVSTLTESFDGSGGLVVDDEGWIYVGDFGDRLNNANGNTISRIDPGSGAIFTYATGLNGASGNTFSEDGTLYQANIRGQSVSKVTPEGLVQTFVSSGLRSPVGLAFDQEGNLYVNNCGGASIRKVAPDGTSTEFVSSNILSCPNGLTIDDSGVLYAANFNNGDVIRIQPDGTAEIFVTIPGGSNSHLTYGNGQLYVLSRAGNQLYRVTLDGEITLIAGSGEFGNADGSGEEASFAVPNGIDLSSDGSKIYVTSGTSRSSLNPVFVRLIELK